MKQPTKYKPLFRGTKKAQTGSQTTRPTSTPKSYTPIFKKNGTPTPRTTRKKPIKKERKKIFSFSKAFRKLQKSLGKIQLPKKKPQLTKEETHSSYFFGEITFLEKKHIDTTGVKAFRETVEIYSYLYTIEPEQVVEGTIDIYDCKL